MKFVVLVGITGTVFAQNGQCYKANKPKAASVASFSSNAPVEQSCLSAHNAQRSIDKMPLLSWDNGLANSAMTWARKLADEVKGLQHSRSGENLYMGSSDCTKAVGAWVAEKPKFTSGVIDKNFAAYGHYTQVVWKKTTKVGCAVYKNYVVCHYDPAGNLSGASPFV